jgi:HK97 family phage major capsid protein
LFFSEVSIVFVQLTKDFLGHAPGQRIDVAEEHGQLLIQRGLAVPIADDPLAPLVGRATEQLTQRLAEGVNVALRQFADAQSQSRRVARPILFGEGDGNPKKSFGDWLLHVARNDAAYLDKVYGTVRTKAALNEASGTGGGYLVPPEFYDGLMRVVAEQTFFRKRAFVQPMASATLMFPYLDVTTVQSAGVSPFFGGVQMTWTEEAQTRTETEPQFKMMELKAHELSGYAVSSNVLLQDAGIGLEKFLLTLFGQAVGWFEEYAFLQGNGVGKPLGVLNSPAAITVNRNTANQVKFVDVATMLSKLLPSSQRRAIWVVHPYVLAQLVQLADSSGRIIWVPNNGGAQDGVPGTLFGLPVITSEKVPALGTKGDCCLIDPQLYVIGDRMQIEIAASEHVNFLKNQMTWRIVERVDGQPWLEKAITLQDASSTVSPFVILN